MIYKRFNNFLQIANWVSQWRVNWDGRIRISADWFAITLRKTVGWPGRWRMGRLQVCRNFGKLRGGLFLLG